MPEYENTQENTGDESWGQDTEDSGQDVSNQDTRISFDVLGDVPRIRSATDFLGSDLRSIFDENARLAAAFEHWPDLLDVAGVNAPHSCVALTNSGGRKR